jgi:hypothetical protein
MLILGDHEMTDGSDLTSASSEHPDLSLSKFSDTQCDNGPASRSTSTADERSISSLFRGVRVGPELGRSILNDPRLLDCDFEAIGALVLLQAHFAVGRFVPAEPRLGAIFFGKHPRAWSKILERLQAGEMPFVVEEEGFLVPCAFGRQVSEEISAARSRAAKTRWAQPADERSATNDSSASQKAQARATAPQLGLAGIEGTSPRGNEGGVGGADAKAQQGRRTRSSDGADPGASNPTSSCPYAAIVDLFHTHCADLKQVTPPSEWPNSRRNKLLGRWKERPDLEFWSGFFQKVGASDFLSGRVREKQFLATFDWLIEPRNFVKVIEGQYQNRWQKKRALFGEGGATKEGAYGSSKVSGDSDWFIKAVEESSKDLSGLDPMRAA